MSNPFFYIRQAEGAMSAQDAACACFRQPDDAFQKLFMEVNGLKPKEMVYPGHTLLYPSLSPSCRTNPALGAQMSRRLSHAHRHAPSPPKPREFNVNFVLASLVPEGKDYAGAGVALTLEAIKARSAHFLVNIAPTIDKLRDIGDSALKVHLGNMALRSTPTDPRLMGKVLASRSALRDSVNRLPKVISQINPAMSGIDAANMSMSDMARRIHMSQARNSGEQAAALIEAANRQIGKSMGQSNRLLIPLDDVGDVAGQTAKQAKVLKYLDYGGAGLTAVTAAFDIRKMYGTADSAQKRFGGSAREAVIVHQSAKIGGGVAGGYVGSLGAGYVIGQATPMLALGPVGWLGFAGVAVLAVGGAYLLSKGGEIAAGQYAEGKLKDIAPQDKGQIDEILNFSDNPVPLATP